MSLHGVRFPAAHSTKHTRHFVTNEFLDDNSCPTVFIALMQGSGLRDKNICNQQLYSASITHPNGLLVMLVH